MYPHCIDEQLLSEWPVPELLATGWCGTPDLEPLEELWAYVEGSFYPCLTGIARPDLVIHFGRPVMGTAGFALRCPVSDPSARVYFYTQPDRCKPPVMIWEPALAAPVRHPPYAPPAPASPLISILLPYSGGSLYHFFRCLQSVLNQVYANWEICLAYQDPPGLLPAHLASWTTSDPRVRLIDGSAAPVASLLTLALREAAGEFIALLDHANELHPDALVEEVRAVANEPRIIITHADADTIDDCGRASLPEHQSSYDPEVFLQRDCLSGFVCLRSAAVRSAGGFHPEFGSAQTWDLLLRLLERNKAGALLHLPRPLYGRRRLNVATQVPEAAAVLERCIARRGLRAEVSEGLTPQTVRVKFYPDEAARIAIFIRKGDGPQQSNILLKSRFPPNAAFFEIGTTSVYRSGSSHPLLTLDETEAHVAVFINGALDRVNHDFFEELIAQAERPECGIVGGATEAGASPAEVQLAAALRPEFFATRIALLAEAGGLAGIRHDGMQKLCNKLERLAMEKGLNVLSTPYSVTVVGS